VNKAFKFVDINLQLQWLGLWCLMPLSTIFQLYHVVSFIGGGNWNIRRKQISRHFSWFCTEQFKFRQ
jgi:hypothetical protein